MRSRCFVALLALPLGACGSSQQPVASPATATATTVAPPAPPTPASVTKAEPGGDAKDPHAAALQRLLSEPWGQRSDRDEQLAVALPDAGNWKRVRYWRVEHFVGFRYGAEHHAMVIVFVQETPEAEPTSQDCLRRFEAWGRPQIQPFSVDFEPFHPHYEKFRGKPLIALSVDGSLNWGFSRPEFSAAWTAYPTYANTCVISAVAVPWRDRKDLAEQVRDRFVQEGFAQFVPIATARPEQKPR